MIKVGISFRALEEMQAGITKLARSLELSLLDAKNEIARETYENIKRDIQQEAKSGRIYKRYNPARLHQASAPGEAPAEDLGSFMRSIQLKEATHSRGRAIVGTNDFRGEIFEHGNARILPRPWLWTNFAKAAQNAENIMVQKLRDRNR